MTVQGLPSRSVVPSSLPFRLRDHSTFFTFPSGPATSNFDESDYTPVRLVLDADRRLCFAEYEEDCEEESVPTSKTEKALEILEVMLGSGPVAVSEIHAVMAEEGIGDKTAQRARRRLGAISDYLNGVPVWKMPE